MVDNFQVPNSKRGWAEDAPCIHSPTTSVCTFFIVKIFIVMSYPHSSDTATPLWPNVSVSEGQRGELPGEGVRHRIWTYLSALERTDPSQAQQDPRKLPLQVSLPLFPVPLCWVECEIPLMWPWFCSWRNPCLSILEWKLAKSSAREMKFCTDFPLTYENPSIPWLWCVLLEAGTVGKYPLCF